MMAVVLQQSLQMIHFTIPGVSLGKKKKKLCSLSHAEKIRVDRSEIIFF